MVALDSRMRIRLLLLPLLIQTTACSEDRLHHLTPERQVTNWLGVVSETDRKRLTHWRDTLVAALREARTTYQTQVDAEGDLLLPDAARETVALPPGKYMCRIIKIGAQDAATPLFRTLPAAPCAIDISGKLLAFRILAGPQRPEGFIFGDSTRRMIMLGSLVFTDEAMAHDYGQDTTRDIVGIVERIGDQRWRILLPAPHFESHYDIIDMRPAQ